MKPGDYLIISSDGLFDNLYEDEIALIIQNHISDTTASSTSTSSSSSNNNKITSEILDSACQTLVHKASKGNLISFHFNVNFGINFLNISLF